jgi:hypothetical protein
MFSSGFQPFSCASGSGPMSGRSPAGSMAERVRATGRGGCSGRGASGRVAAADPVLGAGVPRLAAPPNGFALRLPPFPKGLLLAAPNGLAAGRKRAV